MNGERFRLVYTTKNERHVSSVVLGHEEAQEMLTAEAQVHELFGWTVTRGDDLVVCRKRKRVRVIEIARFTPLDDFPNAMR